MCPSNRVHSSPCRWAALSVPKENPNNVPLGQARHDERPEDGGAERDAAGERALRLPRPPCLVPTEVAEATQIGSDFAAGRRGDRVLSSEPTSALSLRWVASMQARGYPSTVSTVKLHVVDDVSSAE